MKEENFTDRFDRIERLLQEQAILKKEVLNLPEASIYLDLSPSYIYKLTCKNEIPFFKPNGKKLYFNRLELNEWLLQNKSESVDSIESKAANYLINNKRK